MATLVLLSSSLGLGPKMSRDYFWKSWSWHIALISSSSYLFQVIRKATKTHWTGHQRIYHIVADALSLNYDNSFSFLK